MVSINRPLKYSVVLWIEEVFESSFQIQNLCLGLSAIEPQYSLFSNEHKCTINLRDEF